MEKYLEIFTPIANDLGVNIIDIDFVGSDLLELSIARQDFEPVDLDLCAVVANAFGEAVDFEVRLDIGSAGAERMIEPEDYDNLQDQYVFIQFKNPFMGADNVEGTIVSVDQNEIVVSYRLKSVLKQVSIDRENVKMLRLAVKV